MDSPVYAQRAESCSVLNGAVYAERAEGCSVLDSAAYAEGNKSADSSAS